MKKTVHSSKMPPHLERTRNLKQILYGIISIAIGSTSIVLAIEMFSGLLTTKIALATVLCIELIILWLIWQNHLLIPRIGIPLAAYALAVYQCMMSEGIRDAAMFVLPLSIMMSGLLLGEKGIVIFTVLGILAISGITHAEIINITNTTFREYSSYSTMIVFDILLSFIGVVFYVTIRNLNRSVSRLQESEGLLVENNQALMKTQAELEEKVIERTQNLEAARKEIEAANEALQEQMWQITGLAQLGDAMRGDQDSASLARNVIRQLCQYLDLPTGALYLLEAGDLTLTGSYAYADRKQLANRFAIGQGLVGQVAKEQNIIVLSQVPSDYVTVRAAVAKLPLGQILGIPFLYDDQIIGVIELGTLSEFTTSQVQFLEAAVSNIAIAFHTAQARARIDALLAKTQGNAHAHLRAMRGDYVEEN